MDCFVENISDQYSFTFQDVDGGFVHLGMYVNNLLTVPSSNKLKAWIVVQLEAKFKMHMLGNAQANLGTEIEYMDNRSICQQHQGQAVGKLIVCHGLDSTQPVAVLV